MQRNLCCKNNKPSSLYQTKEMDLVAGIYIPSIIPRRCPKCNDRMEIREQARGVIGILKRRFFQVCRNVECDFCESVDDFKQRILRP